MTANFPRVLGMTMLLATASVVPALAQGPMGTPPDFATLDANGDGKITQDEMKAYAAKQGDTRFEAMDANKDGVVTEDEMKAYFMAQAEARIDAMVKKRFEAMDAKKDGKLTKDLFETNPREDKMFARLDKNGDGAISKDEFDAAMARMKKMREHHHRMMQDQGDQGGDGQNP